jgi:hypothetical protein
MQTSLSSFTALQIVSHKMREERFRTETVRLHPQFVLSAAPLVLLLPSPSIILNLRRQKAYRMNMTVRDSPEKTDCAIQNRKGFDTACSCGMITDCIRLRNVLSCTNYVRFYLII